MGVANCNASTYRPIDRYRRLKHTKSFMTSLKLPADTPLRQLTLTLTLTHIAYIESTLYVLNLKFFYAKSVHHSQPEINIGPTANDMPCLRMRRSVISCVLNADSGR